MKKIMFNDKYGLTQAVLEGKKTMTRRIAAELNHPLIEHISEWGQDEKGRAMLSVRYSTGLYNDVYPYYQIGEIVAVAQSYKAVRNIIGDGIHDGRCIKFEEGWNNKMFVRADLMPNRIRITDIKLERLQDISEIDCIKEGIYDEKGVMAGLDDYWAFTFDSSPRTYYTAREAFAALIDKVSGRRGTWDANPYVFAYSFELIKDKL